MRGHESFEVAGVTAQLDFLRGLRWACVGGTSDWGKTGGYAPN